MDVVPKHARIYVDERYQGQVNGWMHQTVVVTPGMKRIELQAKGYMTQRFDIDVKRGEVLTLRLRMQRTLQEISPTPKTRSTRTLRK